MNTTSPAPQPNDPRRRLRELLSVPERDRTDEQWDEIVELEIQLAPGNRVGMTGVPGGKSGASPTGGGPQQPRKPRPKNNNNNNNAPRRPNKPAKPPRDPVA